MNILLIGYCHLADGFLYAANALKKYNYEIFFFPYLIYKMENNNNYIEDFKKKITDHKIDICLWWNNMLVFDEIDKMINKDIINIFFNWDPFLYNYEKYNKFNWKDRIENKKKIYPLMNYIFTCFQKERKHFNKLKIFYNPPGFDKDVSRNVKIINYQCDVSFILTNLYSNKDEFPTEATNINRLDIVNKIYENRHKIKFHIYGPIEFKELYPDCYQGFIKYDDCYKVFSNSKINLSIHPIVKELNDIHSKEEYFSERVPQILGCQGLLMTNSNFTHILKKNEDYLFINDKTDYLNLIINVINNNKDYDKIRLNGYNKALMNYQWDNWASKIYNILSN